MFVKIALAKIKEVVTSKPVVMLGLAVVAAWPFFGWPW